MLSEIRIGKFTSSKIHNLMIPQLKNGNQSKATLTYIEDVAIEKRLGRPLNSTSSARPLIWGNTLEARVAKMIDLEYEYCSDKTIAHPTIPTWVGTPDFLNEITVADAKCPYTVKSFAKLSDICLASDLNALKTEFPEYYWQLVSNAILAHKNRAELIVYCPYLSELEAIKEWISEADDFEDQNKNAWIYFAKNEALPYILDGGYYKNINRFSFDVPEEDKIRLTNAVLVSSSLIIKKEN